MNRTGYIYTFKDENDRVVYVGKTFNKPSLRLYAHYNSARRSRTPFAEWLRDKSSVGFRPPFYVLEEPDVWMLDERERHWIQHFLSIGMPLLNVKLTGRTLKTRPALDFADYPELSGTLATNTNADRPETKFWIKALPVLIGLTMPKIGSAYIPHHWCYIQHWLMWKHKQSFQRPDVNRAVNIEASRQTADITLYRTRYL